MMYILAIFLPPVAVALCGRPFQALLNLLLCLLLFVPAIVHALFVVAETRRDKALRRFMKEEYHA